MKWLDSYSGTTICQSFMLPRYDEMANSLYRYRVSAVQIVCDKFVAYVAGFNWSFTCVYSVCLSLFLLLFEE